MRIGLQPGVYSAALSVGGGAAAVTWPADIEIAYALWALAALILLWGIRWDDRPWWEYIGRKRRIKRLAAKVRKRLEARQRAEQRGADRLLEDMQRRLDEASADTDGRGIMDLMIDKNRREP